MTILAGIAIVGIIVTTTSIVWRFIGAMVDELRR